MSKEFSKSGGFYIQNGVSEMETDVRSAKRGGLRVTRRSTGGKCSGDPGLQFRKSGAARAQNRTEKQRSNGEILETPSLADQ